MIKKRIVLLSILFLLLILSAYMGQSFYVTHAQRTDQEQSEKEKVEQSIIAEAKARVDAEKDIYAKQQALKNKIIDGSYKNENLKVVFLTFDDGPDDNSDEVLDVLKANGVQGTFFTNGRTGDEAARIYNRIINEGHTLANHTWSHNYAYYKTPELLYQDIQKVTDLQRQVTGVEPVKIFRFPGGSTTANQACVDGVTALGYNYFDWNVENGDGLSNNVTPEQSAQRIIDGCHANSVSVVLTHAERPVKAGSRQSLDTVIKTLKSEGYTFLPLDPAYNLARFLQPTGTPAS